MTRLLSVLLVLLASNGWAEEALTLVAPVKKSEKLANGWHPDVKASFNASVSSSDSVVGQDDGDTMTYGGKLDTSMNYKENTTEWRNSLVYTAKTTKNPTIRRFVKSADDLNLESLYLHGLESQPNLGPYVSVGVQAPAFFGESVQSEDNIFRDNTDDSAPVDLSTGRSQRLTDGFKPLTTKESAGLFYKAIERPNTKLEFRLGVGAQQVKAAGQYRVDDDDSTDGIIELKRMEDTSEVGAEYGFNFNGKWNETSSYKFTGTFLTPFGQDIDDGKECDECEDIELTNVDVKLSLATKLNSWASLSYEYSAVKKPQVFNRFQITNGVVFNMEYDFL